jgi:hypothetical protein
VNVRDWSSVLIVGLWWERRISAYKTELNQSLRSLKWKPISCKITFHPSFSSFFNCSS